MSYFIDTSKLPRKEMSPGVMIRLMWGKNLMASIIENAPHVHIMPHSHPHEQGGIVLMGEYDMRIGDEWRHLKVGDAYMIPGGVEHEMKGGDGWALALDMFSPPREDYIEMKPKE